jgi:hypothetical protein
LINGPGDRPLIHAKSGIAQFAYDGTGGRKIDNGKTPTGLESPPEGRIDGVRLVR